MISFASLASLNFSRNSSAPENAIWLIYFLISSAVIPIPLSEIVIVFAFSSSFTRMLRSPSSLLYCPSEESLFTFCVASTALLTSSRRKISLSEYRNFLMIGNIFSVWIDIVPFSSTMVVEIYCCLLHELRRITRIHCSSIARQRIIQTSYQQCAFQSVLSARLTDKQG